MSHQLHSLPNITLSIQLEVSNAFLWQIREERKQSSTQLIFSGGQLYKVEDRYVVNVARECQRYMMNI